jgi:tRNA threonylcarbamoyladenosine biosynthesis protein TsaB
LIVTRLFALSTAEQGASLALFEDDLPVCTALWTSRQTHSKRLMVMVEQMLIDQAGVALTDIDGFIAARGPGSFTGLRIGISVIQGLAYAVSKPCVGVSSLDGIAYRFALSQLPVCVMMDAKRNEVYTAVYRFEGGRLIDKGDECVCDPETAIRSVGDDALFVGSGSKAYRNLIAERTGGKAIHAPTSMDGVSASAMIQKILTSPGWEQSSECHLAPVYLRKSDAERQFGGGGV